MTPQDELSAPDRALEVSPPRHAPDAAIEPAESRFLKWMLFGADGLRVGWSVALFFLLFLFFSGILQTVAILAVAQPFHLDMRAFTPGSALLLEVVQFLPVLAAAAVCALVERRRILDYNFGGERRLRHFLVGLAAGGAALSALIATLYLGGWLRFGAPSLAAGQIVKFGAIWGLVFLLTSLSEEGVNRGYLLFTLSRGIRFPWALGAVALICFFTWLNPGSGSGGVYAMALLGLPPCVALAWKRAPSSGFWQAAWLTSTFFGYIHTFNPGEAPVGIFATASIGVVFCVSVRVTGSAWWALGFHAAWDWMQTFFYGTADSGLAAQGHYLTTTPAGAEFWSGGSTGPEGSVLVIPTIFLVMLALLVAYGRGRGKTGGAIPPASRESSSAAAQPQLS